MNRLTVIGVGAVLVGAVVAGFMSADREQALQGAMPLASTTTPGCTDAGRLWVELYNATDRPIAALDGILSRADAAGAEPVPVGNFRLDLPVSPGQHAGACIAFDEAGIAGRNRSEVNILARATDITFAAVP